MWARMALIWRWLSGMGGVSTMGGKCGVNGCGPAIWSANAWAPVDFQDVSCYRPKNPPAIMVPMRRMKPTTWNKVGYKRLSRRLVSISSTMPSSFGDDGTATRMRGKTSKSRQAEEQFWRVLTSRKQSVYDFLAR